MSLRKKILPRSGSEALSSASPSRIQLLESTLNAPADRRGFLRTMAAGAGGLALAASGASAPSTASAATVGTAPASAQSTQRFVSVPSGFYGLNGHLNSGHAYGSVPMATQLALMQDLGITNVRQDLWDANGALSLVTLANAFAGSGVQITASLTPGLPSTNSEGAAYSTGWLLGNTAANALKGLVSVYECGNELENAFITGAGNKPSDYPAAPYFIYRGVMRGMIDGVRAGDPQAAIAVTGGWLHYGVLQMLADGTDPGGGSNGPTANWDITSWHWYNDMGDITNANGINVLAELTRRFQRPIWIGEFGYRPNGQTGSTLQTNQANYLTSELQRFYDLKQQYPLQCVMVYELFDSPTDTGYGLIQGDGVTIKPAYGAVKNFIASHPAW